MRLTEAPRELLRSGAGRSGAALLLLLLITCLYVLVTYPLDFGSRLWSNPAAWADNPKAVPPAWVRLFERQPPVEHRVFQAQAPSEVIATPSGSVHLYHFRFSYPYSQAPTFISVTIGGVTYQQRPPLITVSLRRPDGLEVRLLRHVPRAPREGESAPFRRYHEHPLRLQLSSDPASLAAVRQFLETEFRLKLDERELIGQVDRILFSTPVQGETGGPEFVPLGGDYEFTVQASLSDNSDRLELVRFVIGGTAYGAMGTDAIGRDLAQGLLFALPVALAIGLFASLLSTMAGAALGIWSGYVGGRTDFLIQRLADIVANIPLLPLLVFMVFVIGTNLSVTILVLVAFSWPGLTIQVRSMVLQIRENQLIEAIRSLGASRSCIMFRHILPQVAPYLLAQLVFFAPAAILAEAGLSFLGLGDPAIPTWGQILEHGFRTGAVYVGYWWWILPPGLLVVLTALTFMLLSLGLERVVNPRLRRLP